MNCMSDILQDLSPPVLAAAIESNNCAQFAYLRHLPQAQVHEEPGLMWFITGVPIRYFNGVAHTRFGDERIDARIDEILSEFKERQIPMLWWVGPSTQPADLGKHLESRGLTHVTTFLGMAADLLSLNEDVSMPPGLTIERVRDREMLKKWMYAVHTGFGFPEEIGEAAFHLFDGLGFDRDLHLCHYVGLMNGEPVASSSRFFGAGVVGINYVATVPQVRGQGIGAVMTLAPLLDARVEGYRIGVLESTAMGASVYRRLGFQEYCILDCYGLPA